jgi:hypothetical protein
MHGAFPAISGAFGVKWHPPRTGREKWSERGRGRGMECGGGGVEIFSS